MRKYFAAIQKMGGKFLPKLQRVKRRVWKGRKMGATIVKTRGNKTMGSYFETGSEKVRAKMHKTLRKKH